jgi:hypothetical protein
MSRDGKFVDIQQIGPQYKTTVMPKCISMKKTKQLSKMVPLLDGTKKLVVIRKSLKSCILSDCEDSILPRVQDDLQKMNHELCLVLSKQSKKYQHAFRSLQTTTSLLNMDS